jgi:septum formation protein
MKSHLALGVDRLTSAGCAPLVLASTSPRRKRILEEAGIHFTIEPSRADEIHVAYCSARELALWNALRKAREVAERNRNAVVIGADTLVTFEGLVIGKPRTLDEARKMLALLGGKTHKVYTGVAILRADPPLKEGFAECSTVRFHPLTRRQIDRYIEEINPLDKAGGYGAQESSSVRLVQEIDGSEANVYGLPIERLLEFLQETPDLRALLPSWQIRSRSVIV